MGDDYTLRVSWVGYRYVLLFLSLEELMSVRSSHGIGF